MVRRYSKIPLREGRETVFVEDIGHANGSFREDVRKYANAMLNSHGGVIYFGVSSSGTIRGKSICRKEEDELRLAIDRTLGSFQPFVSSQLYRLSFICLEEKSYQYIELKVSIGELGEIYEDGTQKVFIIDAAQLIGPLYPQELQELILLKYKQSIEGAEEAAKYCTPNLTRAKTIARTVQKPSTLKTITEAPEPARPPAAINKANVAITKTPSANILINHHRHDMNNSIEITCVKPAVASSKQPLSTSTQINPNAFGPSTSTLIPRLSSVASSTKSTAPTAPKTTPFTVGAKSSSMSSIPTAIQNNSNLPKTRSQTSLQRNNPSPRSCTIRKSPHIRATVQRTYSIGRTPPQQKQPNCNNYNNNNTFVRRDNPLQEHNFNFHNLQFQAPISYPYTVIRRSNVAPPPSQFPPRRPIEYDSGFF